MTEHFPSLTKYRLLLGYLVDRSEAGTGNVLHAKTVIYSSIRTLPPTLNKAVLDQKYVLEKRSLRQIAREISSSKTGVRRALVRFGIPLRKKGQSSNRTHNLPFGKKVIKGKVVDHEGEKRIIELVLKMHKEGLSNYAVARILTEMKMPTKQRGHKWHHEMVRQIILRNRREL